MPNDQRASKGAKVFWLRTKGHQRGLKNFPIDQRALSKDHAQGPNKVISNLLNLFRSQRNISFKGSDLNLDLSGSLSTIRDGIGRGACSVSSL